MSQIEPTQSPQQQQPLPKHNHATATPPARIGKQIAYLTRRETHSSRALISVFVALIIIIALAYLIVEAVLSLLGHAPLLMQPGRMIDHVVMMGTDYHRFIPASIIITGVIIALVGLFLLLKAILPGTLRRHRVYDQRVAIIVDDGVIAAGVSRSLRRHLRLDSDQVTTSAKRRSITPHVTPTSGRIVSADEITRHVNNLVGRWQIRPAMKVDTNLNKEGVVGR